MRNYTNPIIPYTVYGHTADPHVLRWKDKYYHCYMKDDGVYISVADELCDIGIGVEIKIYDAPLCGKNSLWFIWFIIQILSQAAVGTEEVYGYKKIEWDENDMPIFGKPYR